MKSVAAICLRANASCCRARGSCWRASTSCCRAKASCSSCSAFMRLNAALRAAGTEAVSYVVTNAGHSAMERENALALTAVMDGLAPLVRA